VSRAGWREQTQSGRASVAMVTVANAGDNLGIYAPVFATQSTPEIVILRLDC